MSRREDQPRATDVGANLVFALAFSPDQRVIDHEDRPYDCSLSDAAAFMQAVGSFDGDLCVRSSWPTCGSANTTAATAYLYQRGKRTRILFSLWKSEGRSQNTLRAPPGEEFSRINVSNFWTQQP